MTAELTHIRLDRDGAIARLTLNRPDRLNAFVGAMHDDMNAALSLLEADPPRVLIITGAGRGFCAGQDLRELQAHMQAGRAADLGDLLAGAYNVWLQRLYALPVLIIAAVNGVAAGAGIGIALAADLILAARGAQFTLAFGKIGLGPDAGVSLSLPKRIGTQRALGLILTGEPIGADQACDWGLVWQVVEDDALLPAADALARRLTRDSAAAQLATKRLLRGDDPDVLAASDLTTALAREAAVQQRLGHSDFYRNAVLNFGVKNKTS